MKYYIIFIIFFSSFSLYCNEDYILEYNYLFGLQSRYDLNLINNPNNNNLFYSGKIENIENIVYTYRTNKGKEIPILKDENYLLVNILNINYIKYINLFSKKTIFIIGTSNNKYIKNDYLNYTFFSMDNDYLIYSENLEITFNYYVNLGKKLDDSMLNVLYFLLFFSLFTIVFISLIMKKVMKNTDQINQLPIHLLILNISYFLISFHVLNGIVFIFFKIKESFIVLEYMILFFHSFYKSLLYATIILILQGWATISFSGNYVLKYKKLNKGIFLYDAIFTILNIISIYFIHFTNRLNLFYIKNLSEHFTLLCFIIFYIFKILIPLAKQMKYEQSIRSDLVKSIKFKFKMLLSTTKIMAVYTLFFMISPLIEYKYTYHYIDNFEVHLIFQLFYETIFFTLLTIVFYPKKLPRNYFDEIVFNYKSLVFLLANIGGKENDIKINDKKLNISNLNYNLLKKISKKVNYPIVLMNPFTSPKNNSLFNEIHIGIVQSRKK